MRRWAGFAAVLVALAAALAAAANVVDKRVEQQPDLWWLFVVLVGVGAAATATAGVLMTPWWQERQQRRVEAAEAAAAANQARAEQERLRQVELEARLVAAGRGVAGADWRGWYFIGRTKALRDLVSWLHGPKPSDVAQSSQAVDPAGIARVVTGGPGSGKSAVLGRLVTLSEPTRRPQALQAEVEPGTDPGERSLDVVIHAGGKETEQVLDLMAEGAELQLGAEGLPSRVEELQATLRTREREGIRPLLVVIDALDEANDPDQLAREVLRPLAGAASDAGIRLLIGVRPYLIPRLGVDPRAVIDLDKPPWVDPNGLQRYVRRLLLADGDPTARTPYQEQPSTVVDAVAGAVAARAGTTFLVAQLVARTLADDEAVVDLYEPDWQLRFATTVDAAMDGYLARFGSNQTRVRDLLVPLVWAYDPGLADHKVWAQLASALGTAHYTEQDVRWLVRDSAAVDLLQRIEQADGPPAWRLYHEELRRYLRRLVDLAVRDVQERYTAILLDHVPSPPADASGDSRPDWLRADAYTRIHLATHAAAAGQLDRLLTDPGFLLAADPARLLKVLRTTPPASTDAIRSAGVYRGAVVQLRDRPTGEAAAYLELKARQAGVSKLVDQLATAGLDQPWSVRWASWRSAHDHQLIGQHDGEVCGLAISEIDGRPVAVSGGSDGTLRVWDLRSSRPLREPLVAHRDGVIAVAVGELDQRPVAVSLGSDDSDQSVRVWDLTTGQRIGEPLPVPRARAIAVGKVDGQPVIVAGGERDGWVRVWDLRTGQERGTPLRAHRDMQSAEEGVGAVTIGEVGGQPVIVSGGWLDGRVKSWDLATGKPLAVSMDRHSNMVYAVAAGTVDGNPIAVSGGDDRLMYMWNLHSGDFWGVPHFQFGDRGHTDKVNSVAVEATGEPPIAVSGGEDETVRVWELRQGRPVGGPLFGHDGGVRAVAVTEFDSHRFIVSGGQDGTVRLWDAIRASSTSTPANLRTGQVVSPIQALAVGELDGLPIAVSVQDDGIVKVWDTDHGRLIRESLRDQHGRDVEASGALVVSELGGQPVVVLGGRFDGSVQVWDLRTGQLVREPLPRHPSTVHSVAVGMLNGQPIAVTVAAATDGLGPTRASRIQVWGLTTGQPVREPVVVHEPIRTVLLEDLDGSAVAVLSDGKVVWRWDLHDQQPQPLIDLRVRQQLSFAGEVHELMVAPGEIHALATAHLRDRPVVIIGGSGDYRTPQMWDLRTGELVHKLPGHEGEVRALAARQLQGRLLVAFGSDATVQISDLQTTKDQAIEVGSSVQAVALDHDGLLLVATAMGLLGIALPRLSRPA